MSWFNGLLEAVEKLETFPHRCPLATENDAFKDEIRQLIYGRRTGRYRILFTIRADAVHVYMSAMERGAPWSQVQTSNGELRFNLI